MTTIAYRDGVLAGDSAVFDRGCYCGEAVKVFRSSDGAMGAVAGCLGDSYLFQRWFENGAQGDPPAFKDDSSEGLLITGEIVEWIGHGGKRFPISADFHAIGSGFRIAMGAMAAGVGAEEAVKIACSLDENTRAPVHIRRMRG